MIPRAENFITSLLVVELGLRLERRKLRRYHGNPPY